MKVIVIGGGPAAGKSTLIRQIVERAGWEEVVNGEIILVDDHPIQRAAELMSELLLAPFGEGDIRLIDAQLAIEGAPIHTFVHLRTDPATLGMRLRLRREEGDADYNRHRLIELDAYMDAVIPQLCRLYKVHYVPVNWGRGVTMHDIMPALRRVLAQP